MSKHRELTSPTTKALVALVDQTPHGETLPYEDLMDALEVSSRKEVQAVVNRGRRSVEARTDKALQAVRNVGYRVVNPDEHYGLAMHHQRKGRGQLRRALSHVTHVDMTGLDSDERAAIIAARTTLSIQKEFERRADLKYASRESVEELARMTSEKLDRTDAENENMKERIAKLERLVTKE